MFEGPDALGAGPLEQASTETPFEIPVERDASSTPRSDLGQELLRLAHFPRRHCWLPPSLRRCAVELVRNPKQAPPMLIRIKLPDKEFIHRDWRLRRVWRRESVMLEQNLEHCLEQRFPECREDRRHRGIVCECKRPQRALGRFPLGGWHRSISAWTFGHGPPPGVGRTWPYAITQTGLCTVKSSGGDRSGVGREGDWHQAGEAKQPARLKRPARARPSPGDSYS